MNQLARTAAVEIGDLIMYRGRRYCVCGFSRTGSSVQQVTLYDVKKRDFLTVPLGAVERWRELRAAEPGETSPPPGPATNDN